MGIDLAVGGNCQHALHRKKVFMVFQTCLFQLLLFLFQYLCLPTSIVWSQISPSQTPLIKDIPIPYVSHSYYHLTVPVLSAHGYQCCKTLPAVHSYLPNLGMGKWLLSIFFFFTLFSLPASIPKSSLGNVFSVK